MSPVSLPKFGVPGWLTVVQRDKSASCQARRSLQDGTVICAGRQACPQAAAGSHSQPPPPLRSNPGPPGEGVNHHSHAPAPKLFQQHKRMVFASVGNSITI